MLVRVLEPPGATTSPEKRRGMMGAPGSTELKLEERKSIEHLLKEGWTLGAIARSIGRSHSGVKLEVKRNGGREVYNAERAQSNYEAARRAYRINQQKGWTEEQLGIIKEGLEKGWSQREIIKRTKVTPYMLRAYLERTGMKHKANTVVGLYERVGIIEGQIEVILEVLREMKGKPT
jgi:helix-turn-helix protein